MYATMCLLKRISTAHKRTQTSSIEKKNKLHRMRHYLIFLSLKQTPKKQQIVKKLTDK